MEEPTAFQDAIPDNDCWGCGPHNEHGLRIKSYWDGDEAVCRWQPAPYHRAGPPHILNGGIIATVIDCHSICTAIAAFYRAEDRPIGSEPAIWCATGSLEVRYLRPAPLDVSVELRARVSELAARKAIVECSLWARGEECARATAVAIRVHEGWRHGATIDTTQRNDDHPTS